MASVTPAAGAMGASFHRSGSAPSTSVPAPQSVPAAPPPGIERIGPVRVLRGSAGWRGVALRVAAAGEESFEIALTAGDGRSITIATVDHEDAVALWRDCGRASGLSLLLETADGTISEPYPQVGRLSLGPVRIRRAYALLKGRRPRFLARRKTGRLPERPVVHAGGAFADHIR